MQEAVQGEKNMKRKGRTVDDKRLKTQRADQDGTWATTDEILTDKDTENLPLEDKHEELPRQKKGKKPAK